MQLVKQALNLLLLRLSNVISRGILKKITPGKTQTAQITLMKDEVFDGIEFPQTFGFISMPLDGAEAIALFFGGNRDHGTIATIFDKKYAPTDLEEGESCIYNKVSGTRIYLRKNGDVEIKSDSKIAITTPLVTMSGHLEVKGDIRDKVDTNSHNIRQMRDIFNDHVHGGVLPGGGLTLEPTTEQ